MKTKTLIFPLAIILVMFATASQAQSFKFGIKGGTDIKKISGKSFDDQFTYGYHLGITTELGITKKFGIQPEVYFSQVNVDTSSHFSDIHSLSFNKLSNVKLKYINIPILLSYKPSKFVALQAGPQFGILMDDNQTLLQNGRDAFKKGDFSMLAGLQLNISRIRIYGRYALGLNNLNDIDDKDKWKSQTVQLGVGLVL